MFLHGIKMIRQFTEDMKKQKLRCLLTMSGITWGTMTVVLLMTFGESFRVASLKNMTGMGNNIVIIGGGRTSLPYNGMPPGRNIPFREELVDLLREQVTEIGNISPEIQRSMNLSVGPERQRYTCVGIYPEYSILRNLFPAKGGRFIDPLDMENKRRIIFLGTTIRNKFFGEDADPVGEEIMVQGIPFTVIGVMKTKVQNSSYMTGDRNIAFIPFTTFRDVFGINNVNRFILRAGNTEETPRMIERIYQVLGKKLGFDPSDHDAVWNWDTSELTQFLFYFFIIFEAFLLIAGLFTLFVAGIGVANIMYVAIRERRREIGIKSALGATPRLILAQFMLETFLIMIIGGFIGVFLAGIIVELVNTPGLSKAQVVIGTPEINLTVSLITAGLLAVIGFAAGWSPAKSAADMDPVQALEF